MGLYADFVGAKAFNLDSVPVSTAMRTAVHSGAMDFLVGGQKMKRYVRTKRYAYI